MCLLETAPGFEEPAIVPPTRMPGNAVTVQDVVQVHRLIEGCLSRYRTLEETCDLLERLGIERAFTVLVWKRLEAENVEFFQHYHAKVAISHVFDDLEIGNSSS